MECCNGQWLWDFVESGPSRIKEWRGRRSSGGSSSEHCPGVFSVQSDAQGLVKAIAPSGLGFRV